jgi:toxin YoeB
MTYKINILPNAEDDLTWFRKNSKNDYLKCFDLVRSTAIDPRSG